MVEKQHRHDGFGPHVNHSSQYNSDTCGKRCRGMGILRLDGLTGASTTATPATARA